MRYFLNCSTYTGDVKCPYTGNNGRVFTGNKNTYNGSTFTGNKNTYIGYNGSTFTGNNITTLHVNILLVLDFLKTFFFILHKLSQPSFGTKWF